jgi:hypothetical protein
MTSPASSRLCFLIAAAFILSSCGSTQQAGQAMQATWIGKRADDFFVKQGAAQRDQRLSGRKSGDRLSLSKRLSKTSGPAAAIPKRRSPPVCRVCAGRFLKPAGSRWRVFTSVGAARLEASVQGPWTSWGLHTPQRS